MAQLIKPQIKWTPEKIEILKREYPNGDKTKLATLLGISRKTLKNAANRFNVVSTLDTNLYKLKLLANFDDLETMYWLGLIIADGNISKDGYLRISCSEKDASHLLLLSEKLGSKIRFFSTKTAYSSEKRNYCSLCCKDSYYGVIINQFFNIEASKKTYQPVDLSKISDDIKLLAFFIGFFDGDGCFGKNSLNVAQSLKIELHSSWLTTLQLFSELLAKFGINSSVGINSRGFSSLRLYKQASLQKLKTFVLENSLPVISRKWDLVR